MGSEDGDLYIMREGDDGDWVNPTPARSLILEAIEDDGDIDPDDIDEIDEYVDWADLEAVLEGDEERVTFDVEDVEVTIDEDGDIEVA